MTDHIYSVRTERYGVIQILAQNVRAARIMARRFGVLHPGLVWRAAQYVWCERCESQPCCCDPARGGAR